MVKYNPQEHNIKVFASNLITAVRGHMDVETSKPVPVRICLK